MISAKRLNSIYVAECAQTLLYLTLNKAKLQKSEIRMASREGFLVRFKYVFISMLGYKIIYVLYDTYICTYIKLYCVTIY